MNQKSRGVAELCCERFESDILTARFINVFLTTSISSIKDAVIFQKDPLQKIRKQKIIERPPEI